VLIGLKGSISIVIFFDVLITFIMLPFSLYLVLKLKNQNFSRIYLIAMVIMLIFRIILEIVALNGTAYKRHYLDNILKTNKHSTLTENDVHYRDASNYAYFSLFFLNIILGL